METKQKFSISVDKEIFKKIEQLRGTSAHFRSDFINRILVEHFKRVRVTKTQE